MAAKWLRVLVCGLFLLMLTDRAWGNTTLVGPWVTYVNTSGIPLPAGSGMRLSGNIVYGELSALAGGGYASGIASAVRSNGTTAAMGSKIVSLAIPGSAMAKLTRIGIQIGATVLGGLVVDWATRKGLQWVNGALYKPVSSYQRSSSSPDPMPTMLSQYCRNHVVGYAPDGPTATSMVGGGWASCPVSGLGGWCWAYAPTSDCSTCEGGGCYTVYNIALYPPTTHPDWVVTTTTPVAMTNSEIETSIGTSLAGGDGVPTQTAARSLADGGVGQTAAALNEANKSFPSSSPSTSKTTSAQQTEIQNTYNSYINNNDVTNIYNDIDNSITSGTYPATSQTAQPSTQTIQIDPETIAQGVQTGLDRSAAEATTPNAVPAPGAETPPPKKSLTAVLTGFSSSLAALPFTSWLTSQVPGRGSEQSWIELPIPASWGPPVHLDFADHEGLLDFLGNSLLSVVGIMWILWLFRGRGEG